MASWDNGTKRQELETAKKIFEDIMKLLNLCNAVQSSKMEIPQEEGVAERVEFNNIFDITKHLITLRKKMEGLLETIQADSRDGGISPMPTVANADSEVGGILLRPPIENAINNKVIYKVIMGVQDMDFMHLMRILEISDKEMEECKSKARDLKDGKYIMFQLWIKKNEQHQNENLKRELIEALTTLSYGDIAKMISSRKTCLF